MSCTRILTASGNVEMGVQDGGRIFIISGAQLARMIDRYEFTEHFEQLV